MRLGSPRAVRGPVNTRCELLFAAASTPGGAGAGLQGRRAGEGPQREAGRPGQDARPRFAPGRGYLVPQLLQTGVLQAAVIGAVVDEVAAHDPRVLPAVQTVLSQDD